MITGATNISNAGLSSERGQSGSNVAVSGSPSLNGPLRVGSSAQGINSREVTGAGFYGPMELSRNVYEEAVSVGNSVGGGFDGRYHGDGALGSSGDPNVVSWPGTSAVGAGFRGGVWGNLAAYARLSDCLFAATADPSRLFYYGSRGVRSAP